MAGNVEALAKLRDVARHAGETGQVSRIEGLAAAECYARLAASVGTADDRRALVTLLLIRADELARMNHPHAGLRREATHHLKALADAGDDLAGAELLTLANGPGLLPDLPAETSDSIAATFAAAARGDVTALLGMADAAIAMTAFGSPRFDGLVQAEQYARLAAQMGSLPATMALAAILLLRWDDGVAGGLDHAVEALGLALPLVEAGHAPAAVLLSTALLDIFPADLTYLIGHLPALLAHISPEGTA